MRNDFELSANFKMSEFYRTDHEDLFQDNFRCSRHPGVIRNLKSLCFFIMQKVRDNFDAPVIITSGYRCPELNERVGGSPTSQHMLGEAADFRVKGYTDEEVVDWISNNKSITFGQLILEPNWVHVSLPHPNKKFNILINKK